MKTVNLTPALPAESQEAPPAVVPVAPVSLGTLQAATPGSLVSGAAELASELARIIDRQNLAVTIQDRRYVRCEGWTTLAIMLGCTPREISTVENNGTYTSTVELIRFSDGACLSRASAECGADEPAWKSRPRYARRSMAQTRATAKACRLAFSWVMALAGYEPTPAEEIEGVVHDIQPPANGGGNGQARITPAQHRLLEAKIQELGLDREWVKARVRRVWGVEHLTNLTPDRFQDLLSRLPKWAEALQKNGGNGNGGNGQEPVTVSSDPVAGLVEHLLAKAKEVRRQAMYTDSSQARTQDESRAREIEILAGKIEGLSGLPRQLLNRALSCKHSSLEAARIRAEELADEEKAVVLEALSWAKAFRQEVAS